MTIDIVWLSSFCAILALVAGFYWWTVQRVLISVDAVNKVAKSVESLRGEMEINKINLEHQINRNEWVIDQIENYLDKNPDLNFHKRSRPKI